MRVSRIERVLGADRRLLDLRYGGGVSEAGLGLASLSRQPSFVPSDKEDQVNTASKVAPLVTVVLLAVQAAGCFSPPTEELSVSATGTCPPGALSQSQAETIALDEADAVGFLNAAVVESSLLTPAQIDELHRLAPPDSPACLWFVRMTGTKFENRWPTLPTRVPTPTPGTSNTYTTMEVALHFSDGDRLKYRVYTNPSTH